MTLSVWAVQYSNYEPAEVGGIFATEEIAQAWADAWEGPWEVVEWIVRDEMPPPEALGLGRLGK